MSSIGSPPKGAGLAAVIVARFVQPPVAGPVEQVKVMSPWLPSGFITSAKGILGNSWVHSGPGFSVAAAASLQMEWVATLSNMSTAHAALRDSAMKGHLSIMSMV